MKKSVSLASVAAFANADAATKPAAASKNKGGAPKAEDRVAPSFTAVRTDVQRPTSKRGGGKSELALKLEELTVGASIGLTNKTKRQISSTVSKLNNATDNRRPKLDVNGQPVMKQGAPIKNAEGVVTGYGQPVQEFDTVKEFSAFDVDPKSDPDGATVRIFRDK